MAFEEVWAMEISPGDRVRMPEGSSFYEVTEVESNPEDMTIRTSWGSCTIGYDDPVTREVRS